MGVGQKYDHPPVLPPGRHVMRIDRFREQFVVDLGQNFRRHDLCHSLERLIDALNDAEIPCDLYLDGSFVTEKVEPKDLDVAIRMEADVYEALSDQQKALLSEINDGEFIIDLDTFVYVAYPRGHPSFGTAADEKETWAELWGREHDGQYIKGIAVIRLGETDVGHLLRSA